ncbi:putative homoserine kinase type II (protein kinase fold) [Sanguibacter keddieii DSM 10542]|uniref:Homoserine kinase type II (Protein kinase fold) n=1 Tax=Sanguibacter keddieii (strain ATCC 51767 / DSM 10542 / NCFB 3025 / ST-74) TaxID=446469 RepID=D1BBG2_SANKS|nr:phosphotransferase [Sanguibacter keddieii]ACZ20728.1 putative homoserine kinase type II (protein kinase fold) [Sanguibacter keddieii DSM 10542]
MDEQQVVRLVRAAAAAFGVDPARLERLGGATGQVLAVDDVVLRVGYPGVLDHEQVASKAAGHVVPVPATLDRYDDPAGDGAVVLLRRAAGTDAGALEGMSPERARRRGVACGRVQVALGQVPAPAGFPTVRDAGPAAERMLLHLDLHPLNILLDDDDQVTAVVDWTNAAAGPATFDLARTASVLTLDPHLVPLLGHPVWDAFLGGWTEAAGLDALPPEATAWACRYMLEDLGGRYPEAGLAHVRAALDDAVTQGAGETPVR